MSTQTCVGSIQLSTLGQGVPFGGGKTCRSKRQRHRCRAEVRLFIIGTPDDAIQEIERHSAETRATHL